VSPLGTAFRVFLGSSSRAFTWRLIAWLQVLAVMLVTHPRGHAGPVTVAALALDAVAIAVIFRHRLALDRWRARAWAYSERVRWL
jgi:hypothetical protein